MSKFGIDISTWQDNLNYTLASKQGVEFAIIRAGFSTTKDNQFEKHYKNGKSQGWGLGAYWYTYARNKDEARREAYKFLEVVKGKMFDYPLYLDIEDGSLRGLGRNTLNEIVTTFGEIIEDAGYYFGVYSNLDWYNNVISGSELNKKYDWWMACWSNSSPSVGNYGIWQNTSSYYIGGNNVDSDYCYKDYPSIIKNAGLNHLDGTSTNNNQSNNSSNDIKPNVYIVKSGDTLSEIGEMYGYSYTYLAMYNGIKDPNKIYPGQEIRIPDDNFEVKEVVYIVKSGDTLSEIAERYNTTYQKIALDNNIDNPNLIYPGQKLVIK